LYSFAHFSDRIVSSITNHYDVPPSESERDTFSQGERADTFTAESDDARFTSDGRLSSSNQSTIIANGSIGGGVYLKRL
uniref:Polyprotein n=1 Tax=Anisakis simplex TaxID=6269 RepID=A0A0M3JN84_ANISI